MFILFVFVRIEGGIVKMKVEKLLGSYYNNIGKI